MARSPTPDISLQITELEEKNGQENINMNTTLMKSELWSGSKFVSTHNTNSVVEKVEHKTPAIFRGAVQEQCRR